LLGPSNTKEYKVLVNARARERYAVHRERLTDWYIKTIGRSRTSSAEYRKTEAGQATKRKYNKSEKGKATSKAYSQTNKVKDAVKTYANKPEVKVHRKKYLAEYATRPGKQEKANQRSREFRARQKAKKEASKKKGQSTLDSYLNL
jgi:hypothetical protein